MATSRGTSTIKSSPKGRVDTLAKEGVVHTTSTIEPRESDAAESSKISEVELNTAGQRKVNMTWEYTQSSIALMVTLALIYVSVFKIQGTEELKNAFFLIIGFYFSRTNHSAIGGIGAKPIQQYEGR